MKVKYVLLLAVSLLMSGGVYGTGFFGNLKAEVDTFNFKRINKQADKKFEGLAYIKAVDKYEKLISKGFSPDSVRRNLGISYLKLYQPVKAEELLNSLIVNNEATTSDMYFYAQALKYNKKYAEADKWIKEYKALKEDDSRGALQYEAEPVIKDILKKEKYKVEAAHFNSKYSDFGAVVLDSHVVFTSGRNDQAIIKYEYAWKGDPYLDIYKTGIRKPTVFKEANLLSKGINSRYHDGPICYSADGQEVFVTRNNFNLGLPKYSEEKENHFLLYYGKREGAGWTELTELPFNSPEYSCGHPSISNDNQSLYFASDMPGGFGGSDIYVVHRVESGWGEPKNLGSDINTEGDEMFPFISASGELFFSSNGQLGVGGLDIFMAQEVSNGSYGVLNMGYPLNTSADDFSFYLKANGNTGYFASNREGGKGDDDIYQFEILDKPALSMPLIGTTKDSRTKDIIANAMVVVEDSEGNELLKVNSDAKGEFKTEVTPGLYYSIVAEKEKYSPFDMKMLADKNKAIDNVQYIDLLMDEIREWGVFGFIFNKESGEGVKDVEIIITPKGKPDEITAKTDNDGKFREILEEDTDYDILLKKTKYFTRRGEFTTKNMDPGWIDVKEFIEVEMEEIVVGKTIEIPNIYYDLSKWDIRPDAAIELDKIVQFLLDNESITIELGSHTDARGSNSSNQTLSQKRAESAVSYIVEHGIDGSRISAKGYGESKIKNRCADGVKCSEEEHQENRRTEIKIVDF